MDFCCLRNCAKYTGCNKNKLFHMYQITICHILNFGTSVYVLVTKSHLKLLHTVQTTCIQIATGAFCISPSLSLCVETCLLPLATRRLYIIGKLISTIANNRSLSTHETNFLYSQEASILKSLPTSSAI